LIEEKAVETLDRIDNIFEDEIYPKLLFVHTDIAPYKEMLRGLFIEGATVGMKEIFKEISGEEVRDSITRHQRKMH
jgi:hypothetical protein